MALLQKVLEMLDKIALEIVKHPSPGFYSRLFLVEKTSDGWRLVVHLSPLNKFTQQIQFKMETAFSVLKFVRKGDYMASADLKDVYSQDSIHRVYRKYFRIVCHGTFYQFKVPLSVSLQIPLW